MTARWPNAFLLSTTLHVSVVAALLLLGYTLVAPQAPPVIMHLVGAASPQAAERAQAGALARAVSVRFSVPNIVRREPARAPAENVAHAPVARRPEPSARTAVTRSGTATTRPHALVTRPDAGVKHAPRNLHTVRPTAARTAAPSLGGRRSVAAAAPEQRLPAEVGGTTRSSARQRPAAVASSVQRIDVSQEVTALTEAGAAAVGSTGGSGANQSEVEAYTALMEQSLRDALERVPALDEGLRAEAEFRLLRDGRAVDARLIVSSHDDRFDAAVLHAIAALRLPSRPAGMPEVQVLPFTTHLRR